MTQIIINVSILQYFHLNEGQSSAKCHIVSNVFFASVTIRRRDISRIYTYRRFFRARRLNRRFGRQYKHSDALSDEEIMIKFRRLTKDGDGPKN